MFQVFIDFYHGVPQLGWVNYTHFVMKRRKAVMFERHKSIDVTSQIINFVMVCTIYFLLQCVLEMDVLDISGKFFKMLYCEYICNQV